MNLSAPTQIVFYISLALAVLGLLSVFGIISIASMGISNYWIATAAWGVLAFGCVMKGA